MILDRLVADGQAVGDLLVAVAAGDAVEDLDLARGQRRDAAGAVLAGQRQLAEAPSTRRATCGRASTS